MNITVVLMTIIAFSAVISVLSVIFHWLLSPVKDNQIRLETEVKGIQTKLETEVKGIQTKLETEVKGIQKRQVEMQSDISIIKQMLSAKS